MIYTVTFNPSLDYIIRVNDFSTGTINKTTFEKLLPGGKGINVSIVLANLGHESTALGFAAGFTGEEIEARLKQFGFHQSSRRAFTNQRQDEVTRRNRDQRTRTANQ